MLTCDTHSLIFWALAPERLSPTAAKAMVAGALGCSDIVLWEIALLASKGRVFLPVSSDQFLSDLVAALQLQVLPITPAIAQIANGPAFVHGDPADRLIGATAMHHRVGLLSADENLAKVPGLEIVWH